MGAAARAVQIATTLIVTPLMVHQLGLHDFGLWSIFISVSNVLIFLDLGIGSALLSALADADASSDAASPRRVATGALVAVTAAVATSSVLMFIVVAVLPATALPASHSGTQAVRGCLFILIVTYLLQTPAQIAQRLQMARLKSQSAFVAQILGSVATVFACFAATALDAGLAGCVAAFTLPLALALLANAAYVYLHQFPDLRPGGNPSRNEIRHLMRRGFLFFVLQSLAGLYLNLDGVAIGAVLGPASVADYVIPYRLAGLAPTIVSAVAFPIWAMLTTARARGDVAFLARASRRLIRITSAVGVGAGLMLLLGGDQVIRLWIGPSVHPSHLLLALFGLWTWLACVNGIIATVLNGIDEIAVQVRWGLALLVVKFGLAVPMMIHFGVGGLLGASVCAVLLCNLVPFWVHLKRMLRSDDTRWLSQSDVTT